MTQRMRAAILIGGRVNASALVAHHFTRDDIESAYELFAHHRDAILKVAIRP
jgi:alcohol dehydrogenase